MLRAKLRLNYALVVDYEKRYIKENYNYLILHCSLGVDTEGHLINYLNIKNYNWHKAEMPEIRGTCAVGYENRMAGELLRLSYADEGSPSRLIYSTLRER
jgi:hypothetical protein